MEVGEPMTSDNAKKIGIFGGSFNPPHVGHVDICKYLFASGACDQIWVVPCFLHPFGKPLASFEDRLTMCRFTFQEFREKVWVTDVERRLGGISHTVRTIQHFKYQHTDKEFALIVGKDVAGEKEDWKDFERIKKLAATIDIPRGPASPITDISSTEIRRRIRSGEEFSKFVAMPVAVYIITHGLYHD